MSDDGFSEDDSSADEPAGTDGLAEEERAEERTRSEELTFGTLEAMEEDVSPTHDERERDRPKIANSLNEVFMIRSFLDTVTQD